MCYCKNGSISSKSPSSSQPPNFTIFRSDLLRAAHLNVQSFPYVIPSDPHIGMYIRGHAHGARDLGRPNCGSGTADASIIKMIKATIDTTKMIFTKLVRFILFLLQPLTNYLEFLRKIDKILILIQSLQ